MVSLELALQQAQLQGDQDKLQVQLALDKLAIDKEQVDCRLAILKEKNAQLAKSLAQLQTESKARCEEYERQLEQKDGLILAKEHEIKQLQENLTKSGSYFNQTLDQLIP